MPLTQGMKEVEGSHQFVGLFVVSAGFNGRVSNFNTTRHEHLQGRAPRHLRPSFLRAYSRSWCYVGNTAACGRSPLVRHVQKVDMEDVG